MKILSKFRWIWDKETSFQSNVNKIADGQYMELKLKLIIGQKKRNIINQIAQIVVTQFE